MGTDLSHIQYDNYRCPHCGETPVMSIGRMSPALRTWPELDLVGPDGDLEEIKLKCEEGHAWLVYLSDAVR